MNSNLFAEFAELLELDFALHFALILTAPVVYVLAVLAAQFD